MRIKIFLFLFVFLLLNVSKGYGGDICKSQIENVRYGSCQDLCQQVLTDNAKNSYAYVGSIENKGEGIIPKVNQLQCTCFFEKDDPDNEFSLGFRSCSYVVTKYTPDKSGIGHLLDEGPVVRNLINVMTLQGVQTGGVKTGFASSIIANVYYRGLHYFSSYYALILLTIMISGTLFLFGFGNFFEVLKSPGRIWSLLTGTDFKAKASQVILAIVFFGLPVNIEMLNLKKSEVQHSQGNVIKSQKTNLTSLNATQLLIGNSTCSNYITEYERLESFYEKCVIHLSYDTNSTSQSQNNIDSEDVISSEKAENLKGEGKVDEGLLNYYLSKYENEGLCPVIKKEDYLDVKRTAEDKMQKIEEDYYKCVSQNVSDDNMWNGTEFGITNETGNGTFQPRPIKEGLQVPFAVTFVAGFVNFGVGIAEKIADWSSSGVEKYIQFKLTKQNLSLAKDLDGVRAYLQQKAKESKPNLTIYAPECDLSGKSCSDILAENVDNLKFRSDFCLQLFLSAKKRCEAIETISSKLKTFQTAQSQQAQNLQQLFSGATADIKQKFSFLSPAVIPVVMIAYPFLVLDDTFKKSPVIITKIKEGEGADFTNAFIKDSSEGGLWARLKAAKSAIGFTWEALKTGKMGGSSEEDILIEQFNQLFGAVSTDNKFAYLLGYASVMSNIPPGSYIKRTLSDFIQKVLQAASSAAILLGIFSLLMGLIIPYGSTTATLISLASAVLGLAIKAAAPLLSLVLDYLIMILAANIANIVLTVFPFLLIVGAGTIRFIHYLYEIAKTVVSLPFYALPVGMRRSEGVFLFFGDLVKLSIIPILIAASVAFALFFAIIVEYFVFDIPLIVITSFANVGTYQALFLMGIIVAILQILTTLVISYYLFKITMNFPDYMITAIGRLLQFQTTREYVTVGERTVGLLERKALAHF